MKTEGSSDVRSTSRVLDPDCESEKLDGKSKTLHLPSALLGLLHLLHPDLWTADQISGPTESVPARARGQGCRKDSREVLGGYQPSTDEVCE